MSTIPKNDLPKIPPKESPKPESQNSMTKVSSPLVDAWRKKLENSTLTLQEKIEATKVLMKLRQAQERDKALFDKLGLDHNGPPIKKEGM